VAENQKAARSMGRIAGIVAVATLLSKVSGLLRTMAIAAAFGVGITVEAYNYAYNIPAFLFILLGGINGPFHSAIVSSISKQKNQADVAPLVETMTTMVGGILLVVTMFLMLFAGNLIDIAAPGLTHATSVAALERGMAVRTSAIDQLQIMSFMAVLSGFVGIGFGTLNAADMYWLPAISPILSNITTIVGLGIAVLQIGTNISLPEYAIAGGKLLAWTTLIGAILQWLVQVFVQWKAGLGTLRLRFDWWRPGVKETLAVMGPATLSSGMLQINLFVAMYFASFIPGAAPAMLYSNLLIQTPLGIVSMMILVPLLPIFSRLADPKDWTELKDRIRQGLILTGVSMLPLSAMMIALSYPIVQIIYERGAFKAEDSQLVGSVLMASSLGMFVYLGRDVLVRVFYALGDGGTPFKITVVNIFLNALFDYLLWQPLGAPGLVLATVGVNAISCIVLLWSLDRRLNGLPWRSFRPLLGLAAASIITGIATWGASLAWQQLVPASNLITLILQLTIAGGVGLGVFALIASQLKLSEVDIFVDRVRQKLLKR
jgi:putative peptidoglycan lipid II flippase